MSKSQLQDLGIVNEQLGLAQQETKILKLQIATIKKIEAKQNEKLLFYKKASDRIRFASYIELGVGVPCLILGYLPIWNDSQKNIQNLLLGIGATGTISGGAGFIFTIKF